MRQIAHKVLTIAVALSLASSLTACNTQTEDAKATSTASQSKNAENNQSESAEPEAQRKVVLKNAWGESEFSFAPDRPVAIRNGVDELLCFGITPVAMIGSEREANQPWRKGLLDGVQLIPDDDAALEKALAVKPNLVIGDQWEIGPETYKTISPYAPVVAPKNEEIGEGNDWRYRVEAVGKIYGKEKEAEKILRDYDEMIAKAKSELPKLEGKTILSADYSPEEGTINLVVDPNDPSYYLFRDLGMSVPKSVQEALLPQARSGRVRISLEEVRYLDADMILLGAWGGFTKDQAMEKFAEIPGMLDLPAFKADHVMFDEAGANNQAMSKPTSMNRKWLLDYVRPYLEKIGK